MDGRRRIPAILRCSAPTHVGPQSLSRMHFSGPRSAPGSRAEHQAQLLLSRTRVLEKAETYAPNSAETARAGCVSPFLGYSRIGSLFEVLSTKDPHSS